MPIPLKIYVQFWYCSACNTATETRNNTFFIFSPICPGCGKLTEKALSSTAISGRVIVDFTRTDNQTD
jgi:hypothetical protein